ncbi:hypothetical protein BJ508DRAFT_367597 [Ascobolus immersus RN42]|uniref:DUF6604 domain-containing protein n=1 Tax=Ascobolus immersus RN42 TaxID=1160509 RepID=A0A3N4HQ40_ASCIM|nr:hypothetical protein BJ508DRAFT_367597 [Ascobolus immersus RN42]
MFDRDLYRKYKQDTNRLVYWMIHAANAIPSSDGKNTLQKIHRIESPKITVNGIVQVCEAIRTNVGTAPDAIPPTIFRLFRSVISARNQAHSFYNKIILDSPQAKIDHERDNAKHKAFVDALECAFDILGGQEWLKQQKIRTAPPTQTELEKQQEEEERLFSNMFAKLSVGDDHKEDTETEEEEEKTGAAVARRAQTRPGKGKKGKKKTKKVKKITTPQPTDTEFDDFPLESFRIIDGEVGAGQVTDYWLAVYAFYKQTIEVRGYLQGVWKKVAYDKFNAAVAGAVSTVAVAKIKQLQDEIFADFGFHHANFDTIMLTMTRGDPDKACTAFSIDLFHVPYDTQAPAQIMNRKYIDVKEIFCLHAYWDLLSFILDWQATKSWKPTKKMQKELNGWDPKADLRKMTSEERVKWRRQYTINWLYDLIGVYSNVALQQKMKGQNIVYEREDWSWDGKYKDSRRLYGLNKFAGEITAIAMSKLNVEEIKKRIMPHHVVELQLIVDSFTISRGWSQSVFQGHVVKAPARNFKATRDVETFLDREGLTLDSCRGFIPAATIFVELVSKDEPVAGNEGGVHFLHKELLPELCVHFMDSLGRSMLADGLQLDGVPPSRFAAHDSNGLWEYSPYLNGVGLAEALDIAFQYGMYMWDNQPEPMLTVHLHNMLVQKGYLSRPVGLWGSIAELYSHSFFIDGKAPTDKFQKTFAEVLSPSRILHLKDRRHYRKMRKSAPATVEGFLENPNAQFFKNKSLLHVLRKANWDPDAIPDDLLPVPSVTAFRRLEGVKKVTLASGSVVPDPENILVKKLVDAGMDPAVILQTSDMTRRLVNKPRPPLPPQIRAQVNAVAPIAPAYDTISQMDTRGDLIEELKLVQMELLSDINSYILTPFSAVNYISIVIYMYVQWLALETALRGSTNKTVQRIYEGSGGQVVDNKRRLIFTDYMLGKGSEDEELCKLVAKVFDQNRCGFLDNTYWNGLISREEAVSTILVDEGEGPMGLPGGMCGIM